MKKPHKIELIRTGGGLLELWQDSKRAAVFIPRRGSYVAAFVCLVAGFAIGLILGVSINVVYSAFVP